ncbi:ParB/Srx family N-terminal domain-containing protein [Elioraea sp.]|uniref:ParB/Srx family N-terminal domain-containing protein n=1 Tax=Elioraea sp. TaxID=2185103 RepID=UPI0021DF2C2B|nr:ParB/Srx family N-terminal domain-containing protein [Elioraea sp.]GIX10350.1 MAG: hypothetical protein KatS3mg116_2060 [Elioraea sp.]
MHDIPFPPGVPLVPIAALRPHPRNARTHSEAQLAKLAASIRSYGWTNPVLVVGDTIVAGHGRIEAARRLGLDAVPAIRLDHLSPAQRRAYLLADNRLAEDAGWDRTILAEEFEALGALGLDLALTGFEAGEIDAILSQAAGMVAEMDGAYAGDDRRDGAAEDAAGAPPSARGTLAARFGVPPFSVLNAREGWWQERKRAWIALGIRSELGRGGNLLRFSDTLIEPDPEKRAAMQAARAAAPGDASGSPRSAWKVARGDGTYADPPGSVMANA